MVFDYDTFHWANSKVLKIAAKLGGYVFKK